MTYDWSFFITLQEEVVSHTLYLALLREGKTQDEINQALSRKSKVAEQIRGPIVGNRCLDRCHPDIRQHIWEATIRWSAIQLGMLPPSL